MITRSTGSLLLLSLSIGLPSVAAAPDPVTLRTAIMEAWPSGATPTIGVIDTMIQDCGQPQVVLMPPRPGDPLQATLVAQLANDLEPLGIDVLDGERLQSDQEREADMVYAETSDAAAASRVLLGQHGGYDLKWRLEVAIDGPTMLYEVETWEASGSLQATIVDVLTGEELPGIDVTSSSRQQSREAALDRAIEILVTQLASEVGPPILRHWYGFAVGDGLVRIDVRGKVENLDAVKASLLAIEGVESVTRASPAEPVRLLARGWRTAQQIVADLGQGTTQSCRHVTIFIRTGLWWALWVVGGVGGVVAIIVIVMLLTGRQPDPAIEA
ncbi:MAG: hypothetical protein MK116_10860 [Phycisphaerales bacterium]|nr:hypothetical protein [Phycisphaerales bacterium]